MSSNHYPHKIFGLDSPVGCLWPQWKLGWFDRKRQKIRYIRIVITVVSIMVHGPLLCTYTNCLFKLLFFSNYQHWFQIYRTPEKLQDNSILPVHYKVPPSPIKKSPKPINYKTPSPSKHKSPRPSRFQPLSPPIKYQTPSPTRERSSTYTPDRKRASSQHKSRSRSHSRSHSRSRRRRWLIHGCLC